MCDGKQQTEQGTIKGTAPCSQTFHSLNGISWAVLISEFSC